MYQLHGKSWTHTEETTSFEHLPRWHRNKENGIHIHNWKSNDLCSLIQIFKSRGSSLANLSKTADAFHIKYAILRRNCVGALCQQYAKTHASVPGSQSSISGAMKSLKHPRIRNYWTQITEVTHLSWSFTVPPGEAQRHCIKFRKTRWSNRFWSFPNSVVDLETTHWEKVSQMAALQQQTLRPLIASTTSWAPAPLQLWTPLISYILWNLQYVSSALDLQI